MQAFHQGGLPREGGGYTAGTPIHKKLIINEKKPLSLSFNGITLSVLDHKNKILYSTMATSGKGKYMNDPMEQYTPFVGPIPEGKYSFSNANWKYQSKLRQIYNFLIGNGDWGYYNVPLDIISNKTLRSRDSFYLHGGFFKGSAGCIDAGSNISKIYELTKFQKITYLYVNY